MNDEGFRRLLATAKRLETIQNNLESVIDFFLTPIVELYDNLCKDSIKLLFDGEFKLDQFRMTEEIVWKRIYHAIYRFQKAKRQKIKRQDEQLMESHFISGIGFYSTFIVKLRIYHKINDVQGLPEPLNLTLGPLDSIAENKRLNEDFTNEDDSMCTDSNPAKDWAHQAIYRSLVYMGDLARYLLETSQHDYRGLAIKFYRTASRNQPDYGLPFNQLATLSGNSNHCLDAICSYMRCCLRPRPFEAAEGNMRKLFDLNRKHYNDLGEEKTMTMSQVLSSKDPSYAAESMVRAIIIEFIKLISDIWLTPTATSDDKHKDIVLEDLKTFFESLREALELEPIIPLATAASFEQEFYPITGGSSQTDRPRYVTPTIMYEFCSISIMLIARYQKQDGSTKPPSYIRDIVETLALNLLHYSTSKCQRVITSKVRELKMKRRDCSATNSGVGFKQSSETSLTNLSSNDYATSSRRALSRSRQKRAVSNYSDHKKLAQNDDSDMSELEETALSTIDALDISSDISDESKVDDLIDLDSSSEEMSPRLNSLAPGSSNNLSRPGLRPTRSQNYEVKRSIHLNDASTSSLPVIDLVTGDNSGKAIEDSLSPIGSRLDLNNSSANESALEFVYSKTFLPTIKIFCDWLLSDGQIINSNIESFCSFCHEVDDLVSLLEELKKLVDLDQNCEVFQHHFDGANWQQKYPLSCDFPLMNLVPLKNVHELNIEFDYFRDLNATEAGFITIECIKAFSFALNAFLDNKYL